MKNTVPDTGIRKDILLRTNLLVCVVIMLGFIITTWIGHRTNHNIFKRDIENVTGLSSDGIYHEIDTIFAKPIHISLTMGNDQFLKSFLETEQFYTDDIIFRDTMREYLNTYREMYQYDSVFLVSADTGRYYNFDGFDRILEEGDPENTWFYEFLEQSGNYEIVIDNDQAGFADNEVTIFINCRITDSAGRTIGVVGVGFRADMLQQLLKQYEKEYGVRTFLIDKSGNIAVAADRTRFEGETDFFEQSSFPELRDTLLQAGEEKQGFWYTSSKENGYVSSQYVENLGWYLIVDHDTTQLMQILSSRIYKNVIIFIFVVVIILYTITDVIRKYNARIIELTVLAEKEHRTVYQEAAEQLYEKIYEVDITHDRPADEAAVQYFVGLGVPPNLPYGEMLQIIAEKQIKEEYRKGYMDTFSPENIKTAYKDGVENLRYDFLTMKGDGHYSWKRIIAHLFFWEEDQSLRMLIYRENIDSQMKRELYLYEQMKKDSLTGILNKSAAQEGIRDIIAAHADTRFAFFMLDIDCFKGINDSLGHAVGDAVLIGFAQTLKSQFRENDIVGRVGGDEFAAFVPIADIDTVRRKAGLLIDVIHHPLQVEGHIQKISTSIGVALFPQDARSFEELYKKADYALYAAKKRGKDNYVLYQDIGT